ncbi:unnamed protein product [Calicophoron daubneyi]|uniref:J domain-containing protein n=1 Tax=Calicophoron daubneyi TaxID=300641 RepID=A0AAV2TWE6_CALDB
MLRKIIPYALLRGKYLRTQSIVSSTKSCYSLPNVNGSFCNCSSNKLIGHLVSVNDSGKISLSANSSPCLRLFHCTSLSSRKCWECGDVLTACDCFCKCGKIQPVGQTLTYFDALGYPHPCVEIEPHELTQRFREVQKRLHPDKFTQKSSYEQKLASDASTFVNRAYSTLARPADRFQYILSLNGYTGDTTEKEKMDPSFLMEIMELNEDVHNTCKYLCNKNPGDPSPSELGERIQKLVCHISGKIEEEKKNVIRLLKESKWKDAQHTLLRYRYFLRTFEQLEARELCWKGAGVSIKLPTGPL